MLRKKIIIAKEKWKSEIEEMGGVKTFLIASLIMLVALPFLLLYLLILQPFYKCVLMLLDMKVLGIKDSLRKQFYSEEYKQEKGKDWSERRKYMEQHPLIPPGRLKKFDDWEDWPDAYAVDGTAIYVSGGRTLIYVDEHVEEFDVPEGVENIYHRCFACCVELKRVSLPASLKRIGKRVFFDCVSLKEVIIPESVSIIDEEIFLNCTSLENVVLPSKTTEIPKRTFCNCRYLRHFKLPESVKLINVEAFRRCYSLEHIETNDKLELVRERAFEDCRSLKEFIMPETMRSCSEGMFNGCHSLEHIHLSSQIKDFGGSCCQECWNISQITMSVDEQLITYYKDRWNEYSEEVEISTSEKPVPETMFWTMHNSLFFGIPRLTNVCLVFCFSKEASYTIPSFVTNVKPMTFTSCKNLTTLRLSPYIKTTPDPWEIHNVSYDYIYENWPQVKTIIFDESLKNTEFAFGLIA